MRPLTAVGFNWSVVGVLGLRIAFMEVAASGFRAGLVKDILSVTLGVVVWWYKLFLAVIVFGTKVHGASPA